MDYKYSIECNLVLSASGRLPVEEELPKPLQIERVGRNGLGGSYQLMKSDAVVRQGKVVRLGGKILLDMYGGEY